ncbi:hypothetical protein N656DRAFT_777110 [Canariomyces notabilis]|uniref:Uncharacterized protein n=1 Tax=Canariomyces notabilis TaxID=2074819 RepID=A0AAN6YVW4_9PEZI|nr:hypothetical protein N656DRAFT_777110 [Canariomyces arenarius]
MARAVSTYSGFRLLREQTCDLPLLLVALPPAQCHSLRTRQHRSSRRDTASLTLSVDSITRGTSNVPSYYAYPSAFPTGRHKQVCWATSAEGYPASSSTSPAESRVCPAAL